MAGILALQELRNEDLVLVGACASAVRIVYSNETEARQRAGEIEPTCRACATLPKTSLMRRMAVVGLGDPILSAS